MTDLTYPIKVLHSQLESFKKQARVNCEYLYEDHLEKLHKEAKERIPQLEAAIKLLKENNK